MAEPDEPMGLDGLAWDDESSPLAGEDERVLDAVVMAKVLRDDGQVVHRWRFTEGMTDVEVLGHAHAVAAVVTERIARSVP